MPGKRSRITSSGSATRRCCSSRTRPSFASCASNSWRTASSTFGDSSHGNRTNPSSSSIWPASTRRSPASPPRSAPRSSRRMPIARAIAIWERIVRETPDDPGARMALAECLFALGDKHAAIGQHGESLRCFEQSLAILVPLARADSGESHTRSLLGSTLNNQGFEQERVNETAAAIRTFREALPILEALARDGPGDAHTRREHDRRYRGRPILATWNRDLAHGYGGLGVALQSAGQPVEALHSLEKAVTVRRGLVRDYPNVPDYQRDLATSLSKVGLLLDELGQPASALLIHQEALAIFDTRLRHIGSDQVREGRTSRHHRLDRRDPAQTGPDGRRDWLVRTGPQGDLEAGWRSPRGSSGSGRPSASATRVSPRSIATSDGGRRHSRTAGRGPADPGVDPAGLAHVSLPPGLLPQSSHPARRRGPDPAPRSRGWPPVRRSSDGRTAACGRRWFQDPGNLMDFDSQNR